MLFVRSRWGPGKPRLGDKGFRCLARQWPHIQVPLRLYSEQGVENAGYDQAYGLRILQSTLTEGSFLLAGASCAR